MMVRTRTRTRTVRTMVRLLKFRLLSLLHLPLFTGEFIEDEPTVETPSYTPWRHFANMDENSDEAGWGDLVESLEKRYTTDSEGNHRHQRPFESHPIAPSIEDIIRQMPTTDDYPLWRIRCKVSLHTHSLTYPTYHLSS